VTISDSWRAVYRIVIDRPHNNNNNNNKRLALTRGARSR
jgi:hypothetical protein